MIFKNLSVGFCIQEMEVWERHKSVETLIQNIKTNYEIVLKTNAVSISYYYYYYYNYY